MVSLDSKGEVERQPLGPNADFTLQDSAQKIAVSFLPSSAHFRHHSIAKYGMDGGDKSGQSKLEVDKLNEGPWKYKENLLPRFGQYETVHLRQSPDCRLVY
jgi:hypothetical protein